MPDRFSTVVIDPPWPITMAGRHAGRHSSRPDLPYRTMSLEQIGALPVDSICDRGAHVYLWATNKTLRPAFDILEGWGVSFHLVMPMVKPSGMAPAIGYVFGSEFVLLGFYGKPMQKFINVGKLNWLTMPKGEKHSVKPKSFYSLVEEMSPPPRADLFARQSREGWQVWGDEVDPDFLFAAEAAPNA